MEAVDMKDSACPDGMHRVSIVANVLAPQTTSADEVAAMVGRLIDIGVADANETRRSGEGDLEQACAAAALLIAPPVALGGGPQLGKVAEVVVDAYGSSDEGDAPTYATIRVDDQLVRQLKTMSAACRALSLTEVRCVWAPDWGPPGVGESLRLGCPELVVTADGAFYFEDLPHGADYAVQSRAQSLDRVLQEVLQAAHRSRIFLGDGVRERYAEDHEDVDQEVSPLPTHPRQR